MYLPVYIRIRRRVSLILLAKLPLQVGVSWCATMWCGVLLCAVYKKISRILLSSTSHGRNIPNVLVLNAERVESISVNTYYVRSILCCKLLVRMLKLCMKFLIQNCFSNKNFWYGQFLFFPRTHPGGRSFN